MVTNGPDYVLEGGHMEPSDSPEGERCPEKPLGFWLQCQRCNALEK
jgi:hypothetical protein